MIRFLFIVLVATPLFAHDFWIEPSSFRPRAGEKVTLSLRVGEHFDGEPVARRAARIDSFVLIGSAGTRAVNGMEGSDPAGVVTIDDAGSAVIGYRGKATPHRVSAATFEKYLQEEGIEHLSPASKGFQREHFYRYAKTIVGSSGPLPSPVGFRLELQPAGDPFSQSPVAIALTLDGAPLPGALVTAMNRDGARISARSDERGIVTLALGKGVWLIKSTWVIRAQAGDHDWDSLWASLTFER